MKTLVTKSFATFIVLFFTVIAMAQPADSLKITYDATKSGAGCQPIGAAKMYMHSGVGIGGANDAWEVVVGNWGQDDGIGQLSPTGNADEWTITIHIWDYYGVDHDSTLTNIGLVFRNEDGTMEGKSDSCSDIFIRGLATGALKVENADGTEFDGVTAEFLSVGIEDITSSVSSISAFPNPVKNVSNIRYITNENIDNLQITVMDALGREIATLYNGSQTAGMHTVQWDASNVNSGIYFYNFSNGSSIITKKLLVIK